MTFEDDFIQVTIQGKHHRLRCNQLQLDWPPPETVEIYGFTCKRMRYSKITDEQREDMTHVCRGAEYEVMQKMEKNHARSITQGAGTYQYGGKKLIVRL